MIDGEDVLAMSEEDLPEFRRFRASMVFQKFGSARTVQDNAAYGLMIQGLDKKEAIEKALTGERVVGLVLRTTIQHSFQAATASWLGKSAGNRC